MLKNKSARLLEVVALLLLGLVIYVVTSHDAFLYQQPIGQVVKVNNGPGQAQSDEFDNHDRVTSQYLKLKILNGKYRNWSVNLKNNYSKSGALDQKFKVGQQIFLDVHQVKKGKINASIATYKRDTYLLMLCWLIFSLLFLTMRFQGLRSLFSVAINFVIFLGLVQFDVAWNQTYFFWIFALGALIFTGLSLVIVLGFNKQCWVTFSSIIIGTGLGLLLGYGALWLTDSKGLHYEALDMATQDPEQLFFSITLIGLLGAVMDAATDIVSTVFEMKASMPEVSKTQLFKSGHQVGKSIMGPLINVLFLVFFAESFAIGVLYFRTGNTIAYTFEWTMSLGVVQSLISGIGIALVVPTAAFLAAQALGGKKDVSH